MHEPQGERRGDGAARAARSTQDGTGVVWLVLGVAAAACTIYWLAPSPNDSGSGSVAVEAAQSPADLCIDLVTARLTDPDGAEFGRPEVAAQEDGLVEVAGVVTTDGSLVSAKQAHRYVCVLESDSTTWRVQELTIDGT